ncbi:cysteine proteinase COT44-like [Silene latifolia]|uniref:cysteine proteinase COT44-like n=1 Tax=Silene latifolia TaxID=37657 RepID=UPI003D77BC58
MSWDAAVPTSVLLPELSQSMETTVPIFGPLYTKTSTVVKKTKRCEEYPIQFDDYFPPFKKCRLVGSLWSSSAFSLRSCWAFSTVAAVEGLHKIETGKLVSFSEQELVDCLHPDGCGRPGNMKYAYNYIAENGFSDFPSGENLLMQALNVQPISVGIESHANGFNHYSGGIYDGGCGTNLNHAVTAIGHGRDAASGKNYWLIKNSWGASWGENGYMRLLRDERVCPLTLDCSYPVIE